MRARNVLLQSMAASVFVLPIMVHAAERPHGSVQRSKTTVEYRKLPFSTFRYVDGMMTATWDADRYDVSDVALAADYQRLAEVEPGQPRAFALDAEKGRYDMVGWVTDRATGERSQFISPVRTSGGFTASTLHEEGESPLSCTLTESVDCPDGSSVSVTCSGSTGSCVSCSLGKTACCRASTEDETVMRDGRVVRQVVITRDSDTCPAPEPRPGDRPHVIVD